MFIEDFIEELRGRYQPYGNVCVITTTNLPGCTEPRYDEVLLHEHKRSGVKVRLVDLHAQYPTVIIDVSSHPSLNYPLGTATSDVMQKANQGYPNMPQELKSIERYSNIIFDAYTKAIAYDKSCSKP